MLAYATKRSIGACPIHELPAHSYLLDSATHSARPASGVALLHRQDRAVDVLPLGLQVVDELMKTKIQAHIIGPVVQALGLQLRGQLSKRQQPCAAAAETCSYVPLLRMPVVRLQSGPFDIR